MNKLQSPQLEESIAANSPSQNPMLLPGDWRVAKAIRFMREQMHLNPTLTEAAVLVRLSTDRLRHLFIKHTGCTFDQYLKHLRLEAARELLEAEDLTIQEIVDRVGCKGLNHFTVDFKKKYGISPGKYRNCYLLQVYSAVTSH